MDGFAEKSVRSGTSWARHFLADKWVVATVVLAAFWTAAGFVAVDISIRNHFGGLATSIMDGVDSLGLSRIWDLQANLQESRTFMHLMMWGFHPSHALFKMIFGDTWAALYMQLALSILTVTAGGLVVFAYSMATSRDSRSSFLVTVLYFLLPASFANTAYWYGQPVFVFLMAAMWMMRAGWIWPTLPLVVWAFGCHPLAAAVFAGMAYVAFRAPGRAAVPLLPGLDRRDAFSARGWRFSVVLCVVLTVWTAILVIQSRIGSSEDTRGLLWHFFSGKLNLYAIPYNLVQTFFFLLPVLFFPLTSRVWLPAFVSVAGYMVFGSQGAVTGFSLPATGFAVAAFAHSLASFERRRRAVLAMLAIGLALLVNLAVPWSNVFPLTVEPLTGGVLSGNSWRVHPKEEAINRMISNNIKTVQNECLTSWQEGPVMAAHCRRVTTLSFPFRQTSYELKDFLEIGDAGRLAGGFWDSVLVDLRRERNAPGLDELLTRIEKSGMYVEAGRTDEAVLFMKRQARQ